MFRQISREVTVQSKGSRYSSSAHVLASGKEVSIPAKIVAVLFCPYKIDQPIYKFEKVIVPARTGQMSILPGRQLTTHVPLMHGVISLINGNGTTKYFISSGFAFIHEHSFLSIVTPEAIPLDLIDPDKVQKGLAEFTQKLSSASTDLEKVEAQIGVEVHTGLSTALQEMWVIRHPARR